MLLRIVFVFVAVQWMGLRTAWAIEDQTTGPLSPDDVAAEFRVEPGFRIELAAAEPLVESPVAMAFDERGRLFVAENRGYPTGGADGAPQGRIALLEDVDHDGRFDRRTTFADGLTFPNGVLPWNDGLVATCAPDILFLRDRDGDGQADQRDVWFTGFATTGSTQLRASHPTLSLDGWIYVTGGLVGGTVQCPASPAPQPLTLGREDFRFRPDRSQWESAGGGSQFGLSFDDFGRRFICHNRVQARHVVFEPGVFERNPRLAATETVHDCPIDRVAEPLRGHGAAARLYPIGPNVTTADSHAGTFTAACATTVIRGDSLSAEYNGAVFSADPTGGLIHVDRLTPHGATFDARPLLEGREFVASRDGWFRPVFLAQGPDGGLYVCDMYRKTIEHPDYLPVEIRKRTDFTSGKNMGRVWRIVPDAATSADLAAQRQSDLSQESTDDLCALLADSNGWRRATAQRLLWQRRDAAAIGPLQELVALESAPAFAVAAALHLLVAHEAASDELLVACLRHAAPGVRESALRILERRLVARPELAAPIAALAKAADPRVRFQAAVCLGALSQGVDKLSRPPLAVEALAAIALCDGDDRWTRTAVLAAIGGIEWEFFDALGRRQNADVAPSPLFHEELGQLLGACVESDGWADAAVRVLASNAGGAFAERAALVVGFAHAARRRGAPPERTIESMLDESRVAARERLTELLDTARSVAVDETRLESERVVAIDLLAQTDFDAVGDDLLRLVAPSTSDTVAVAAIDALVAWGNAEIPNALLASERFAALTPTLREKAIGAIISQPQHVDALLSALESGELPRAAIDAQRRRQLTEHPHPSVRERAQRQFEAVQSDRRQVYEDLKSVVKLQANSENGRKVFGRVCANCHRLDQAGHAVGPDLFGIRNQPKESILLHILSPDQEIATGFAAYTVATVDGRVFQGLLASESPNSITLRMPQGVEESILRSDIEMLSASSASLMPRGVEGDVTRQELADLLAYLKGEGPPASERSESP